MKNRFLIFLLSVALIKQMIWVSLVPLWHFPDEQAHFAQTAFLTEKGKTPDDENKDLTKEILLSEELLGTNRDKSGNNRFTFHPNYRIPYSDNLTGIFEREIQNISKDPSFRQMAGREATRYPPFYYFLLAVFYKIFYFSSLFVRVFAARIIQLVFYLGTVYLSYLIADLIFKKNRFLTGTLAILVAFHPMFSFVSAGINSDNIGNFLFALFIWLSLRAIKSNLTVKQFTAVSLSAFLGIYVKPQFNITIPLIILIIAYKIFSVEKNLKKKINKLAIYSAFLFSFVFLVLKISTGPLSIVVRLWKIFSLTDFINQIRFYALPHLYREVLPWYWGIFDWLGVTYPRPVHRIINWIILFSLIGFISYLIRNLKKINRWPVNGILFLLSVNILFFLGVYLFDWLQFAVSGFKFHLGVQGRYFFPLLVSHLLFLVIGWRELFRFFPKLVNNAVKILVFLMFFLHWFAVYTIVKTYYDLSSVNTFIIQASQYKPWFFKGNLLLFLLLLTLTVNLVFLLKYHQTPQKYDQD